MPNRQVICSDVFTSPLMQTTQTQTAIFASLPDYGELKKLTLVAWQDWFVQTAKLLFSVADQNSPIIFSQTDIYKEGVWIDKAYLIQKAGEQAGVPLRWHKIVCKSLPGKSFSSVSSYSHLLCFSLSEIKKASFEIPDVILSNGKKTWVAGMGLETSLNLARYIKENTNCHTLLNPFCGEGSMLAAANFLGLNAIGIEKNQKRAQVAENVMIAQDGTRFINF